MAGDDSAAISGGPTSTAADAKEAETYLAAEQCTGLLYFDARRREEVVLERGPRPQPLCIGLRQKFLLDSRAAAGLQLHHARSWPEAHGDSTVQRLVCAGNSMYLLGETTGHHQHAAGGSHTAATQLPATPCCFGIEYTLYKLNLRTTEAAAASDIPIDPAPIQGHNGSERRQQPSRSSNDDTTGGFINYLQAKWEHFDYLWYSKRFAAQAQKNGAALSSTVNELCRAVTGSGEGGSKG